jgi:hypothetical protein
VTVAEPEPTSVFTTVVPGSVVATPVTATVPVVHPAPAAGGRR